MQGLFYTFLEKLEASLNEGNIEDAKYFLRILVTAHKDVERQLRVREDKAMRLKRLLREVAEGDLE